jgi:hypothetical protein
MTLTTGSDAAPCPVDSLAPERHRFRVTWAAMPYDVGDYDHASAPKVTPDAVSGGDSRESPTRGERFPHQWR